MKRTLFLVFSCAIVVFSIICLCTGPIINGIIKDSDGWGTNNCKKDSDEYKNLKDTLGADADLTKDKKKERNLCNRRKAMYGLEYSSYIIDVSLGFICAVLGLLHFFDIGKSFQKYSGLIGLITGIVGFVLTLVYIIYSGYIFTKDLAIDNGSSFPSLSTLTTRSSYLLKLNGKGAFAKKDGDGGKFKCIYYNKDDKNAILAKYNDLGKKSFNYEKKRNYDVSSDISNCLRNAGTAYTDCSTSESFTLSSSYSSCDYLYLNFKATGFENKYLYDNWVTNIIFGCFIIACNIGLAIFGFLVFKNSDGSGI